jgi:hypothetical protein
MHVGHSLRMILHAQWTAFAHVMQTVLGQGGLVQRRHRAQHTPKGLAGTLHCV